VEREPEDENIELPQVHKNVKRKINWDREETEARGVTAIYEKRARHWLPLRRRARLKHS